MRNTALLLAAATFAGTAADAQVAEQSGLPSGAQPADTLAQSTQSAAGRPSAHGQAPEGLTDIIVTAQRRAERLQDVPVAVTALDSRELERRQVTDIQALASNAPAITFSSAPQGRNSLILAIRGVAPGGTLPNVDQAVGTYVDGLYYARSEGTNFALVDLASAEVLRGPQGTLFGRNTIGGALNLTTNKPSYELGGALKANYGNYGALNLTGIVNTPLVADKIAVRVIGSHAEHSGYGRSVLLGDVADENDDYVRGLVRADVSETLRVDLSGDYLNSKNHHALWVLRDYLPGTSPAAVAQFVAPKGSRISQQGFNPLNRSEFYSLTGVATLKIGEATLKAITGYRNIDVQSAYDQDGTPLPTIDARQQDFSGDQISQEVQINGKAAGGKLTYTAGLYYFHEKAQNPALIRQGAAFQFNFLAARNNSASAFAQLTYEILPKLRLTGGVRYAVDKRRIRYRRQTFMVSPALATAVDPPASAIAAATCPYLAIGLATDPVACSFRPNDIRFKTVPFTIGIDYKPDEDGLLYAKFSKGYRSGGFQQPTGTTRVFFTPFKDESVDSYEAGAKLSLLDRRLRLSAAVYHSTYSDVQQTSLLSTTPTVVLAVTNAGKERIYGGEFEATALISKLQLAAAIGIIQPKFTDGPYVGTPVPTVAKRTLNLSGDLPLGIASFGTITFHADYNYKSKVNFTPVGSVGASGVLVPYTAFQAAAVTQKGYGLLNARMTFELADLPLTIGVFGRNLTNVYYAGRTGSLIAAGYNSIVVGDPRTYGVTASYTF